jgi:hypothetical protein
VLNPEQVEKMRMHLNSVAWRDVIQPMLAQRAHELLKESIRLPSERGKPYTELDDSTASAHIRGRIAELEWMLTAWANEVQIHDFNRSQEQQQLQMNGSNEEVAAANPLG